MHFLNILVTVFKFLWQIITKFSGLHFCVFRFLRSIHFIKSSIHEKFRVEFLLLAASKVCMVPNIVSLPIRRRIFWRAIFAWGLYLAYDVVWRSICLFLVSPCENQGTKGDETKMCKSTFKHHHRPKIDPGQNLFARKFWERLERYLSLAPGRVCSPARGNPENCLKIPAKKMRKPFLA